MFCAFEGAPRIMRLFGTGAVCRVDTSEFNALFSKHYTSDNCDIHDSTGKRSIIVVDVYKVGSSCGYGVPFYDYKGSRPTLTNYWNKKPAEQVAEYWVKKNTISLDGLPGMRHERMGDRWTMLNGEDRKKLNQFKDANGDRGRWWDAKYLLENASSVAVGAGIGTVVGAAVATVLFMNKRA
ncbi:hypothetical protein BGZ96_005409 [Linnemannia gamsii]|uniref:Uncharacterized protein n=1 Tax=Linnemannia gamsii TaxID=64522 RepID=A0ABQ7JHD3_9FUNG|nr:hypothetical protein BGZ96_005409 [Linnemannia gamsii]